MGYTLAQLQAMDAGPSAAPATGLTLDQLKAQDAAAQDKIGGLEAFGRGALQGATLGFSDELGGAIKSIFNDKTYAQNRDEIRARDAAAENQHPLLSGAGNLAGGVATSFIPGLGIAKGAGLAEAALKSAAVGAGYGAGASTASDASGIASDALRGGVTAGVIGGALHGVASKIEGQSQGAFEKATNEDLFNKAKPKDYLKASQVQGANKEIFQEVVYGKDFEPVQKLARAGKTAEALDAANEFVDKAGANRLSNYAKASEGDYQAKVGPVVDRIEQEASARSASEGAAGEAKALTSMASYLKSTLSTIPRSAIDAADTADPIKALLTHLPERDTYTKSDLWQAAVKESGGKTAGDVTTGVAKAIDGLPFHYDPDAGIDLLRLRKITTAAQTAAKETLGSIAETEHSRIAKATETVVNDALEADLDRAAKTSPAAAKAVAAIRHDDKAISIGLSAKDGLATKLQKESIGKGATLASRLQEGGGGVLKGLGLGSLMHGNIGTGVAEIVAPHVFKAAGAGLRKANDTLARLLYAEKQGNPFAAKALATLRATPQGLARLAALHAPDNHITGATPALAQAPSPTAPNLSALASTTDSPAPAADDDDDEEE